MTMNEEILSQDEVDALLKGVTGEPDVSEDEVEQGAIRSYDLAKQERIVRGRMPTLEIIHERFARLLRMALFGFTRRNPEISVGQIKIAKYGEFMRNLVVPTNINICHMRPLRGMSLFIFDPSLVFLVIDNLFGGDGRYHTRIEGRDFTPTEQRIVQRMLELVFDAYGKSWAPVFPVEFEHIRTEINTQFANVATPTEVVVTATFNIELGQGSGDFHVCIPYAMIEPIRVLLSSSTQGEHMEIDHRWIKLMEIQLRGTDLKLRAPFAHADMLLSDVSKLKVGDIIPIEIDEIITADVANVPLMRCRYGTHNGHYALKIEEMLPNADLELDGDSSHA